MKDEPTEYSPSAGLLIITEEDGEKSHDEQVDEIHVREAARLLSVGVPSMGGDDLRITEEIVSRMCMEKVAGDSR